MKKTIRKELISNSFDVCFLRLWILKFKFWLDICNANTSTINKIIISSIMYPIGYIMLPNLKISISYTLVLLCTIKIDNVGGCQSQYFSYEIQKRTGWLSAAVPSRTGRDRRVSSRLEKFRARQSPSRLDPENFERDRPHLVSSRSRRDKFRDTFHWLILMPKNVTSNEISWKWYPKTYQIIIFNL